MKRTLLDMTQDILSDGDSDEINSIADSVEAMQVARIIRTTYEEIISSRQWPHLSQPTSLTAAGDSSKPTHFTIADDVQYIEWIKYNNKTDTESIILDAPELIGVLTFPAAIVGVPYLYDASGIFTVPETITVEESDEVWIDVVYMPPKAFLDMLHARTSTNSNTQVVVDGTAGNLLIKLDKQPQYWTSFDDETIIMDSLDNTIVGQDTLTTERTMTSAYIEPIFTLEDEFIPDLPSKSFSYLLAEAKSVAFNTLFQEANSKEEQRSRRQRIYTSRNARRQNKGIRTPDYGRKPSGQQRTKSESVLAETGNRPSFLPD